MNWITNNLGLIFELALAHLGQCLPPIAAALLVSIPLGWLSNRMKVAGGALLSFIGLFYVIPSLALFALLPPLLGISFLSPINLMIALCLYASALLTRYAADGFRSIDVLTLSAAKAVGYGTFARFWRVELPLAGPVILAGLRVATMTTVSLATVGALIGATNLGYLFTNGYQRQIPEEILAGVVACLVLALTLDRLLAIAGRLFLPWTVAK